MNDEKIRVCWNCFQIYHYERRTSRYCCDSCRVQDNNKRAEEIRLAVFKLELEQKNERMLKSFNVLMDYKDMLAEKKGK